MLPFLSSNQTTQKFGNIQLHKLLFLPCPKAQNSTADAHDYRITQANVALQNNIYHNLKAMGQWKINGQHFQLQLYTYCTNEVIS